MNRKQYKNKVISKTLACLMAAVLSINMYPTSRVWADEEGTEDTEAAAEAEDGAAPVMIEEEAPPIEDPYLKNRLLVETDTPDIFRDGEVILSDYQGVYLVGFKTAEEMDEAYDYYKSEADIVEYDSDIMAVSDEDSGEENGVSEDAPTDSITILNDIVTDGGCPQGTIAVIDTGAGEGAAEYISVIGEDGGDDHGHGSRVIKRILMENRDAGIISIKAFGSDGRAKASDIYAAFMYAIERGVSYINLSASSIAAKDSDIVKDAIQAAVDSGITVVGAAGNQGKDAAGFIPGCIEDAVIIGSADEEGRRQEISNYGDTVDYYVTAESTSIATARFTGMLSKYGMKDMRDGDAEKGVFTREMIREPGSASGENDKSKTDEHSESQEKTEEIKKQENPDNTEEQKEDTAHEEIQNIIESLDEEDRRSYLENIYDILNEEDTETDALREIEAMFEVQDQWEVSSDWCAGYLSRRLIGEGSLPGGSVTQSVYQLRGMLDAAGWTVVKDTGRAYYSMGSAQLAADINEVAEAGDAILFYGSGADVMYMVHCGYANGDGTMDDKPGQYRALRTDHNISGYVTSTTGAKGTNGFVIYRKNKPYDFNLTVEKSSSTTFKPSMKGIRYDLVDSNGIVYAVFTLDENGRVSSADSIAITAARATASMRNVSAVKGSDGRYYYHFTIDNISSWGDQSFRIVEKTTNASYKLNTKATYVRDWNAGEYKLISGATNENLIDEAVTGEMKGMIEVYKVDDYGRPLAGAVFSVTDANSNKEVGRITTNKRGFGTLTGLNAGRYKVKEIKTPDGYDGSNKEYTVNISTSKTFASAGQSYSYVFNSDYYASAYEDMKRYYGTDTGKLATHFLEHGMDERRRAAANFDIEAYKNSDENADLRGYFGDDNRKYYIHYQNHGAAEQRMGRKPSDYQALPEGVSGDGNAAVTIKAVNHPKRADVKLSKRDESGKPMADVEFVIKSETTGETKTIKTDKDGNYDSAKAGLWFEVNKDGTKSARIAGLGALPLGTYTVSEKRCDANKGKQLEPPVTFKAEDSVTYVVKDGNISGNEITNVGMPKMGTTASVVETGTKIASLGEITIRDVVAYSNLRVGTEYTLAGMIMIVSEDGSTAVYKNEGKDYIVTKTFKTPTEYKKSVYEISGSVSLDFNVNTKALEGKKLVVFEKLYLGTTVPKEDSEILQYKDAQGEKIFPVVHEDINDEGQTIYIPSGSTSATDAKTKGHITLAEKEASITDVLTYKNLEAGAKYTVKGTLMDKESGKAVTGEDGKEIVVSKEFTAEQSEGVVEIPFSFDASLLGGKTIVVYEDVYYNGKAVIVHHDITDEAQTIHIPECSTDAKDGKTGLKVGKAEPGAEVIDTVYYSNLIPGESYSVLGTLMDASTGEPLLDDNNEEIHGTASIVPEQPEEQVDVVFSFDASELKDKTIVVYEEVFLGETAVLIHKDIEDANQMVRFEKEEIPDQPPVTPPEEKPPVETPPENVTPPEEVTPPTPTPPSDITPPSPPETVTPPSDTTPPEKVTPPTDKTPPTGDTVPVVVMIIISMAAAIGALIVEKKRRR